jgi:alpha-N-acetylglucosaminidase
MELLLASDRRFLLGHWLEAAKAKATTRYEIENYEWNARAQITLWGQNSTNKVMNVFSVFFYSLMFQV